MRIAPAVEFETGPSPDATVILIHGLGASADTFLPVARKLASSQESPVRFILPNAPMRPVTWCEGRIMSAWYDLVEDDFLAQEDEVGMRQSERYFRSLIHNEMHRGIPPSRVIIGGFSQGGAMSLLTGLEFPDQLAGVFALSGYLPLRTRLAMEHITVRNGLPIFLGHGGQDEYVPLFRAEEARDQLRGWGHSVSYNCYALGHTINEQELKSLSSWISATLDH
ncbi:alpha/beta hydrolase [Komagataeibacter nataicola]|uniref:alpha/beta hydrolase n=1 Tax=Komagataeibacter nataicola TaxID=265960 RepID=UPI0038CF6ED5